MASKQKRMMRYHYFRLSLLPLQRKIDCFTVAISSTAYRAKTDEEKKVGDKIEKIEKFGFVGSSSEYTLPQLLEPWRYDYEKLRFGANIQHVYEFSSACKKMSTMAKEGEVIRTYMKDDPEFCLGLCAHYLTAQGERLEITETAKQQIPDQVAVFATESLCTILILQQLHQRRL